MAHGEASPRTGTVLLAILLALVLGSVLFALNGSSTNDDGAAFDGASPARTSVVSTNPETVATLPGPPMPDELAFTEPDGEQPGQDDERGGFSLNLDLDDAPANTETDEATTTTTTLAPAAPAPPAKSNAPGAVGVSVPDMPAAPAVFDLRAPLAGAASWSGIGDAADPFVLSAKGGYFAYTTNTSAGHVPVWFSTDLGSWRAVGDALPDLPTWAAPSATQTWAPAVTLRGSTYVLYFTTRDSASNRQCIGAATASRPEGPFSSAASSPLVCQTSLGGSIDPSTFVDANGQAYLLFKNDGNCCRILTSIWSQPLASDGLSLVGSPRQLLWSTLPWEGSLVEGPSMIQVGGRYHLIYSANSWSSNRYAMGHAVCESAQGPCYKSSSNPWRVSDGGPGGGEFFVDVSGTVRLAFHEWRYRIGYPGGVRSMYFERLSFDGSPPATTIPSTIPPSTTPPTTVPPTTVLPTTVPPTTVPPSTVPPTTAPSTTVPPTTSPSTVVPPATVSSSTVPPTTVLPTTVPPTTGPSATSPESPSTTLAS